MTIENDKLADQANYGVVAVAATAKQIVAIPVSGGGEQGLLVKAPASNSGVAYVGFSGVTADQTATGGFPLDPGDAITLPVKDASKWYVIGSGGDFVNWVNL